MDCGDRTKSRGVSDPILGIDDLLGRYQSAGETDSSGSFTLDPKKARERLAKFALPSHYHWILKVIQSLHLSGASTIEIEAGINKVRFGADAVPTGFESLDDLLAQLLVDSEQSSPALRHLAAGLQGSLAVKPQDITAKVTEDGETRTFILQSGGWRDGPKETAEPGIARFQLLLIRNVTEKLSSSWFTLNTDIFDLFFKRRAALSREGAIVHDNVPFADCQINLGGKLVSRRDFGQPRFPGYKVQADMNPGSAKPSFIKTVLSRVSIVRGAADSRHHLVEIVVPSETPGGIRLSQHSHATKSNRDNPEIAKKAAANGLSRAYALRMELHSQAIVVFVEDGVIIQQLRLKAGKEPGENLDPCPGLVALVDAREFRKDLTTINVVQDEQYDALIQELNEASRQLKQLVAENLDIMPGKRDIQSRLLGSN